MIKTAPLWLTILLLLAACTTVPITGRQQFNFVPPSSMNTLSAEQYRAFLSEHPLSSRAEDRQLVERVGRRIQQGVEQFFAVRNQDAALEGYEWEFNLVEDEQINAWCAPGGKIIVYTGLLPIAQDEAGLAVVMSHEVAHAVAQHSNERMSQMLVMELGGTALSAALQSQPDKTRDLAMLAFGAGTQLGVLLPYSRTHEYEADELGLHFMVMAGYDPNAAIPFWERMAEAKEGAAPPEFLSTHPADASRIAKIKKLIPEVMKYKMDN